MSIIGPNHPINPFSPADSLRDSSVKVDKPQGNPPQATPDPTASEAPAILADPDTQNTLKAPTFALNQEVSFDQALSERQLSSVEQVSSVTSLRETEQQSQVFARAAVQGLSPAVDKLRQELSPDIPKADVEMALLQASLWNLGQA